MIQTLPAPAAIEPSEFPIVVLIVAVTSPVFRSTREIVWSPQLGTHTLPNPAARPEQGLARRRSWPTTVFVLGSRRDTLSFGLFETHTCSSIASQSGVPGTRNTASGFRRSIGILHAGRLDPWLWRPVCGGAPGARQEPQQQKPCNEH